MKKIILIMLLIPLLCKAQNTNYGSSSGTSGNNNAFFGAYSGRITTGYDNVFSGYQTGYGNTIGSDNVFLGYKSGYTNTSGSNNIFIGYKTGYSNTSGTYNVFVGYNSGYKNTTGVNNVFTGHGAGKNNTTGSENTFSGRQSGYYNSTGGYNVFIGTKSGYSNSTGGYNVFTGYKAGYSNTSGIYNVFTGYGAGSYNTIGSNNVFTGYESGFKNTSGTYNVFTGFESGNSNTTGSQNVFTGRQSGNGNTTGNQNVYLGYKSGFNNSTGSNNVFLGYKAGESETGSNRLYIDNSNTNTPLIYGKFDTNQLGINTNAIPTGYAMAIKGKLITEEVKVQLYGTSGWPDYVFVSDYNLPSLRDVEKHIKEKGHLKDIPSAEEVAENGILLGNMNAKLLQKIEELTLYAIEQEKQLEKQEILINEQSDVNQELKERLLRLEQLVLNRNQKN